MNNLINRELNDMTSKQLERAARLIIQQAIQDNDFSLVPTATYAFCNSPLKLGNNNIPIGVGFVVTVADMGEGEQELLDRIMVHLNHISSEISRGAQ